MLDSGILGVEGDVWQLGILIVYMLMGYYPFSGSTDL